MAHFQQTGFLNSLILISFLHSSTDHNGLNHLEDSIEDKILFHHPEKFHHDKFYISVVPESFQTYYSHLLLFFPYSLENSGCIMSVLIWTPSALLKQVSQLVPLIAFWFTLFSIRAKESLPFRPGWIRRCTSRVCILRSPTPTTHMHSVHGTLLEAIQSKIPLKYV